MPTLINQTWHGLSVFVTKWPHLWYVCGIETCTGCGQKVKMGGEGECCGLIFDFCHFIFKLRGLLNNPFKPESKKKTFHPLQSANCSRHSRLVVDEDDLKWVTNEINCCHILLKQLLEIFRSITFYFMFPPYFLNSIELFVFIILTES